MSLLVDVKSWIDILIKILEVVIWPGTMLIIIFMFRNQFRSAMGRLGSFEASATGVSMTFEPKLDKAKALFKTLKPESLSKNAVNIASSKDIKGTPIEQVSAMRHELFSTLSELGQESNLNVQGKSAHELCSDLEKSGVISHDNATLMHAILDVLNAANANVSQDQVDEIRSMIDSI